MVQRAIEAHGGLKAWEGMQDASFDTTWTHYRAGRRSFSTRYRIKFPTSGPMRAIIEGEENGKPVLMGVSGSRSWFLVGDERREDLESLKANRAFVRWAYALLALPFRLDDPSYRFVHDGEEVRAGALVDRVRVEHGLDPPILYLFDRDSGRLAGLGSMVTDPPTFTVGEAHDLEAVEGILIPRTQVFDRVDPSTGSRTRALSVTVDDVRFRNNFPEATFQPPPVP